MFIRNNTDGYLWAYAFKAKGKGKDLRKLGGKISEGLFYLGSSAYYRRSSWVFPLSYINIKT